MFRAIVFDFDGTLVNSNYIKSCGFKSVIKKNNGNLALIDKVCELNKGSRWDIFTKYESILRSKIVDKSDLIVKSYVAEYNDIVDTQIIQADEMLGATKLLEQIKALNKYIILSSLTPKENLIKILKARAWNDYFDYVSGSPNTKISTLQFICSKFELNSKDIAVVGDGVDDQESARAFGAHFFPVGEARGLKFGEKKYSLLELSKFLQDRNKSEISHSQSL